LPGNIVTFVARRAVNAVITLILMIAIVFIIVHLIAPTPLDLARIYAPNPKVPKAELEILAVSQGFTKPLPIQFLNYVENVFTGNFGTDLIYGNPEWEDIAKFLPISLQFVIIGNVVGVLLGLYTGAISASNRNSKTDYGIKGVYLVSYSAPTFIVGAILQLVIAYYLGLLPATGMVDQTLNAPPTVTGFPLVDGLIAGNWKYLTSVTQHLVLPVVAIAITSFGLITRLTRASMIDALDRDYVKLAYMKGLTKRKVVYGTAFRNALIPIITIVAITFGLSFGGAVVLEDVFRYQGIGFFAINAVYSLDYVAILGTTIVLGIGVIAANLVADILYGVADPRARLS
jgi:peptide/nickel transport system permease protein